MKMDLFPCLIQNNNDVLKDKKSINKEQKVFIRQIRCYNMDIDKHKIIIKL